VSNTLDPTCDVVVRELRRRGTPFVRLNTDEYPSLIRATVRVVGNRVDRLLTWDNRRRPADLGDIRVVWYRRPVPPRAPSDLADGLRKFVRDEAYDFLRGLWYSLDCPWVSPPDSIRKAEHKVFQLAIAARLGLPVPRTLVSNDPEHIRNFFSTCPNGVVAKPVYMGFIDDPPRSVFTTPITATDLDDAESLRISPVIFQERVHKIADVRVTVIGESLFAAEITSDLPDSIPDWRAADAGKLRYAVHSLPSNVVEQCRALVRELGLEFGAIDLGLTRDGQYAFFEINPNGQWAWLEPETGLPLTATLVDLLQRHAS
jgi:glutathione synthase/RimK-type ligase-like ATP-grasp enzyme